MDKSDERPEASSSSVNTKSTSDDERAEIYNREIWVESMTRRAKVTLNKNNVLYSFNNGLNIKDLQDLIQLDVSVFDILDLAPLNEYERYIRDFGSQNTNQVLSRRFA